MRYLVSIALLSLMSFAHGQIYKWVDANGKVQFSDQPPPKAQAQTIRVTPSSGMGSTTAQPTLADKEAEMKKRREAQKQDEAEAEEADRKAQELASYCSQLRGQLQAMNKARNVVRYDESGKRDKLSADERRAEREKIQAEIDKRCTN